MSIGASPVDEESTNPPSVAPTMESHGLLGLMAFHGLDHSDVPVW
jgi:hypothetical protein